MRENYFRAQRSPQAFIAFSVELACVAIAWSFSWVAGVAVIVSVFTQSAWSLWLQEQEKKLEGASHDQA